jgi:hypothetical protein
LISKEREEAYDRDYTQRGLMMRETHLGMLGIRDAIHTQSYLHPIQFYPLIPSPCSSPLSLSTQVIPVTDITSSYSPPETSLPQSASSSPKLQVEAGTPFQRSKEGMQRRNLVLRPSPLLPHRRRGQKKGRSGQKALQKLPNLTLHSP